MFFFVCVCVCCAHAAAAAAVAQSYKLQERYPYFLANKAVYANEKLAVTDKYSGEVATKVALADAATIAEAGTGAAFCGRRARAGRRGCTRTDTPTHPLCASCAHCVVVLFRSPHREPCVTFFEKIRCFDPTAFDMIRPPSTRRVSISTFCSLLSNNQPKQRDNKIKIKSKNKSKIKYTNKQKKLKIKIKTASIQIELNKLKCKQLPRQMLLVTPAARCRRSCARRC